MPDQFVPPIEVQPVNPDEVMPPLVSADALAVAARADVGVRVKRPLADIPEDPNDAAKLGDAEFIRKQVETLRDYPITAQVVRSPVSGPLVREQIAAAKIWERAVKDAADQRPDLPVVSGLVAELRRSQLQAGMMIGAIPALAQRAMGGDADWWYKMPDAIASEQRAKAGFKSTTTQEVVNSITASVADPINLVLPAAGFAAGAGTKAAIGAAKAATVLTEQQIKAGLTGAAMASGAAQSVRTVANAAMARLDRGELPTMSTEDYVWAAVDGTATGMLEKLGGVVGALAAFRGKSTIAEVVGKDIVVGGAVEAGQGGASAIAEGGMERDFSDLTIGNLLTQMALEGAGGAGIGMLNLPFAFRDAYRKHIGDMVQKATDVTKTSTLNQGAESIGHIMRSLPKEAARPLAKLLGEHSNAAFYWEGDKWNNYWTGKGIDPVTQVTFLGGVIQQDGSVKVPLLDLMTHLHSDDATMADLNEIKTATPGGYDLADFAEAYNEAPKILEQVKNDLIERAKTVHGGAIDDSGLIVDSVRKQITDGDFNSKIKQSSTPIAQLAAISYHTLANDLNRELGTKYTPHELWQKYGISAFTKDLVPGARGALLGREMSFGKMADKSTPLHEMGHHFLDVRSAIAAGSEGSPALQKEFADFNKWISDNADEVVSSFVKLGTTSDAQKSRIAALGGAQFVRDNVGRLHELSKSPDTDAAWAAIHEYFARGWETYVSTGKAQTKELKGIFQKFSAWLSKVYSVARNLIGAKLETTLTPEAVRFMDRMLVTSDAIAEYESRTKFPDVAELLAQNKDIPDVVKDEMLRKTETIREQVRENIIQREIKNEKKLHAKEKQAILKQIRDGIEYDEEGRAYLIQSILRDGTTPWGDDLPANQFANEKIHAEDTKEIVDSETYKKLMDMGMLHSRGAKAIAIAENFMFDDPADMLRMIANLKPWKLREQEMLAEAFGGLPDDATMRVAIEKEFAGPRKDEMLAAEMAVLISDFKVNHAERLKLQKQINDVKAKMTERVAELKAEIKDANKAANKTMDDAMVDAEFRRLKDVGIRDMKLAAIKLQDKLDALEARTWRDRFKETKSETELRRANVQLAIEASPINTLSAEQMATSARRHREKAIKAIAQNDYETAYKSLRAESNALFSVDAINDTLAEYEKTKDAINLYARNTETRNKLRSGAALVVADGGTISFYETTEQVQTHLASKPNAVFMGQAVDVVDKIISDYSQRGPDGKTFVHETMPVEYSKSFLRTIESLRDGVENVNVQTEKSQAASTKAQAEKLSSIALENKPAKPPGENNLADRALYYVAGVAARFSTYVDRVAGSNINEWHETVLYPIQKVTTAARVTADNYTATFNEIAKKTKLFDHKAGVYDANAKKIPVPNTNFALSMQDRRALLCLMGSVEGKQRVEEHVRVLMGADRKGSVGDVQHALAAIGATFTADDAAYAQAIWAQNEANMVAIEDAYRKIGETPPKRVKNLKVVVNGKVLDGGYYTIEYADAVTKTPEDMIKVVTGQVSVHQQPEPSQGFANTRVGEVIGRKLNLSPAVHTRHLSEVANVVEKLALAKRLMRVMAPGNGVMNSITAGYGDNYARDFNASMWSALTGPPPPVGGLDMALSKFRGRVTAAGLMFKMASMLKQPLALTNAVAHKDINASALAGALLRVATSPKDTVNFVNLKSKFMQDRYRLLSDSTRDAYAAIEGMPLESAVGKFGFGGFAVMQGTVDYPTWVVAYEGYLKKGMSDDTAIQAADQLVRDTMGSGEESEMTALHRGQWSRLLTVFGNYNITQLNMIMKSVQGFRKDDAKTWLALAGSLFWVVMAASMANYAADYALKGGKFGPGDGEGYTSWITRQQAKAITDMSPFGRIGSDVAFGDAKQLNIPAFRPALNLAVAVKEAGVDPMRGKGFNGEQFGKAILGASPLVLPVSLPIGLIDQMVFADDVRGAVLGRPLNQSR